MEGMAAVKVRWTWTSYEQAMLQAGSLTGSVQVGGRLRLSKLLCTRHSSSKP